MSTAAKNPIMKTTLGKIAYDEYCQARDWKSVRGEPLPQFDEQTTDLKEAWERAAWTVALKVKETMDRAVRDAFGIGVP